MDMELIDWLNCYTFPEEEKYVDLDYDAIQVSKMYWRHVDQSTKPVTFHEAFYMATLGGGEFFGKVGSFEESYDFDAAVLDYTTLVHPQKLSVTERLDRAVYLGLDTHGIRAKYTM